jgi:predicted transcriptional regulator
MSLIPTQHVEPRDTVPVSMDHALHARLEQYAAFIESPKHYVVAQALERLFRSDKKFIKWLTERPEP